MWQIYLNCHQMMWILPLKKRVNPDKCSFATKQCMFGVAIDVILRYRWALLTGLRTLCHPGVHLRVYSAWIWRKSVPWFLFSSKNALWALIHSQRGMSGSFPTYQSYAKIIDPEKNILWVAWTLWCFLYISIKWISLLQALSFSMCCVEHVNFFIGWDQFHT